MITKKAVWAAAVAFVFAVPSLAQTTGAIIGKVIGEDGKPLQGALVKFARQDIKANYKIKTNKKGEYGYYTLPIGTYNVTLEVGGRDVDFAKNVKVSLTNESTTVDFDLQKNKKRSEELSRAMASGGLTKEQQQSMSAEERAAYEQGKKQREAQLSKDKKLNDAFNAGMHALECARRPGGCPPPAAAEGQPAPAPLTAEQNYEEAVASFKKAGEMDPNQPAIWSQMAEAYVGLAGTKKEAADKEAALSSAAETYQKAIATKPLSGALHNNYALVLARQGKFDEAKAELQKAAELDPVEGGKYYYNLGALLVNGGKWEQAAEVFKKAIELTPNYPESHYQYAMCLSAKLTTGPDGKTIAPPGMAEELQKYLELAPNGPNAQAAKEMLATLNSTVQTTYTNPNAPPPAAKKTKKK
jgi:tetratricopeptide (TPR) repeat protein